MKMGPSKQEVSTSPMRTPEQVREHYEIEKALAARLKQASREERLSLYSSLYDTLFKKVPHHPQLTRKASLSENAEALRRRMTFLERFLDPKQTFMEIGPGDCALSFAISERVQEVFAIDVSKEITHSSDAPDNVHLRITDGTSIPVPPGSVHLAYSNQLMEHLHPDDALQQLNNVYRALASGGRYICITPNKITGPHDISRGFDNEATGFHLKEYTASELSRLFNRVGFKNVKLFVGAKGLDFHCPSFVIFTLEKFLGSLPKATRDFLIKRRLVKRLLEITIVGEK